MGGSVGSARADRRPPFTGRPRWRAAPCSRAVSPRSRSPRCSQSCGDPGLAFSGVERIPSPDDPIRWTSATSTEIIESGLTPEAGSTLRIYNYADYLSPRVLKDFEKKYDVDIRLSTFNDADEALTKIATGNLEFDLYFPSYDSLGPADHRRPAPAAQPGLPDQHAPTCGTASATRGTTSAAQYTRPYTIYSTGIGWRTDRVPEEVGDRDNPYDVFWDTQYKGDLAILDDWHTAMGMVLLRNGARHEQHRRGRHRHGPRAAARAAATRWTRR